MDPFLTKFLKNYQPKNLSSLLTPYKKCKKLKGYHFLKKSRLNKLIPFSTYIRYIPIKDSYIDKNYSKHIKCGGILLKGGTLINGKFKKKTTEQNGLIYYSNLTRHQLSTIKMKLLKTDWKNQKFMLYGWTKIMFFSVHILEKHS